MSSPETDDDRDRLAGHYTEDRIMGHIDPRAIAEEAILNFAMNAGAETIVITWPGELFDRGLTRYELGEHRRALEEAQTPPAYRLPFASWPLHNLVGHPLSEVLHLVGLGDIGNVIHDATAPEHDPGTGRG